MSNFLFDHIIKNTFRVSTIAIAGLLTLTSIPANAKPIKIGTATTFDFIGCTKSSSENDIICVGNFRNRDADKQIYVSRTSTVLTDYDGKNYNPDELKISDQSCRRNCTHQGVVLVEGVDYKTYFIFKDISLSSPKIALFQITSSNYTFPEIKIRKISVGNSRTSQTSSENITPSLTDQEELKNAANEVEKQDRERIATAQAEQLKKDREALARKKKQSASISKKPASSWLDQQVNQGILDLLGKPKKPGKK
jgi:hypothetical protein